MNVHVNACMYIHTYIIITCAYVLYVFPLSLCVLYLFYLSPSLYVDYMYVYIDIHTHLPYAYIDSTGLGVGARALG